MNRQQNGALVVQHPAVADPYSRVGRLQTKWFNRRDFLLGFLAVFSLCSLLLNGIFLFHLSHPSFWRDFKLSWLHPPPVRANDHIRGDFECVRHDRRICGFSVSLLSADARLAPNIGTGGKDQVGL